EIRIFLVLPDRIELSTSPLPRECSTTELRQRAPGAANRRPEAGPACHKGEGRRKRGLPSRPLCATTLSAMRKSDTDRKQERVERLRAALRENLRRRKAQARGRKAQARPQPQEGEAADSGEGRKD